MFFKAKLSSFKHWTKKVSIFCESIFSVNIFSKWTSTTLTPSSVSVIFVSQTDFTECCVKIGQIEEECIFPRFYWEVSNFYYLTGPRNWIEALLLSQVVVMDPGVSSSIFYFFASHFLLKMMHAILKNDREEPL